MAGQLKLRRGTTSQLANFIGSEGELTYNTTLKSLVLHDGVTEGGVKIPYLSNGSVPSTMLPTATESVVGASKIATTAIAQAGTNDTDIITPAKLKGYLDTKVLGINQTWQNVTSSRFSDTVYTNTTGKTIIVKVSSGYTSSSNTVYLYVNEIEVQQIRNDADGSVNAWADLIVPSGSTYRINSSAGFSNWSELR